MEKKLQRDENRKMLAGVAAGLAEYFDIDVTWVRVIFVLMAVFGFSGVLIYIILWIVVPPKPFFESFRNYEADYKVYDAPETGPAEPRQFVYPPVRKEGKGRYVAGIILIAAGSYFLLNELNYIPYWFSLHKLWPVILIVIGLLIIGNSGKRNTFNGFNKPADDKKGSETNVNDSNQTGDQPLV